MKQTLINTANEAAYNTAAFLLAALGLSLPLPHYIGGLLFAMAAASIVAGTRKDPRKIWVMLLTAIVFATVVAIAWPYFGLDWPVQLPMFAIGFASGWVSKFLIKFLDRVIERTDDIADNVIEKVTDTKEPPKFVPKGPGTIENTTLGNDDEDNSR